MRRSAALGGRTASEFLRRYWQKSPHLIRRAIPGFKPPISIESLLELACTEGVEARLVQRVAKRPHWQVAHGPFTKKMLRALPATNWTLLVQDCDKHLPQLAEFLKQFDFVP
ncbi:MAG: cupin domain-containing protein, partial [Gammaproteobacteria bacterium]|nr:cupin domain-containing protein [Gammaproteobacteria bacterium]